MRWGSESQCSHDNYMNSIFRSHTYCEGYFFCCKHDRAVHFHTNWPIRCLLWNNHALARTRKNFHRKWAKYWGLARSLTSWPLLFEGVDGAIHPIKRYPLDNSIGFASVCTLDSEQPRPALLQPPAVNLRATCCNRAAVFAILFPKKKDQQKQLL